MEVVKEEVMQSEEPKVVKKPVYDPSKDYNWSKDATFELSGGEFGLLLNTLRQFVNSPETQKTLMAVRSATALEELLARAVSEGVAKEKTKEA